MGMADDGRSNPAHATGAALSKSPNGASAEPPPLVAFDPAGRASIINYSLPEGMSYSGRRLLDLGFAGADFLDFATTASDTPGPASVQQQLTARAGFALSDPRSAVSAPPSVVLTSYSGPDDDVKAVVDAGSAPFACSERLAKLTWGAVGNIAAADRHVDILRSIGGLLDFRVRRAPQPPALTAPPSDSVKSATSPRGLITARPVDDGGGGPGPVDPPAVDIIISSPSHTGPQVSGPVQLTVTGSTTWTGTATPTVTVEVDDQAPVAAALTLTAAEAGTFSAVVTLDQSKRYTITVRARAQRVIAGAWCTDFDSVAVDVAVPPNPPAPKPVPTVTISDPGPHSLITTTTGKAAYTLKGTCAANGTTAPLTITVAGTADDLGGTASIQDGAWSQVVELNGYGEHRITVHCTSADGAVAPEMSVTIKLVVAPTAHPIDRRLFLVETIAISSFLGDYGAGRLLKTFSLLPGEKTTIHVETYRKDESTQKTAQSILDSTASECAQDFENTLNAEQDRKANDASSHSFSLAVEADAHFGPIGGASLKSNYTTQANSSREQVTKDIRNALDKHSMKASANRNVTVNTEFNATTSTGETTDTQRELANINVSRVLNFVFRQMVQEHLVLIHLVDAKIGYYEQDVVLDAAGNAADIQERYTEYSLPEFRDLARAILTGGEAAAANAHAKLEELLGSIADAEGNLTSLAETVTPKRDGQPQPDEQYMRVKPDLRQDWKPRDGGPTVTVPGIILSHQQIVMRTEGVVADSILAQGPALDSYSAGLQSVSVAERQVGVERQQLAIEIVKGQNEAQAAIFTKVFPPPPTLSTTTTTTASSDGGH